MRKRRVIVTAVITAGLALLAGCGGQQVGSADSLKDIKGSPHTGNLGAIPSPSPSPVPVATQAPAPAPVQKSQAPAPPAPVQTRPAPPPPAANKFPISINPDTDPNPGFDPQNATVPRGTVVVWTNKDSRPHQITAQNGAFNGSVAPGGTFTWTASSPGKFSYQDPNVPYDVGTITVS